MSKNSRYSCASRKRFDSIDFEDSGETSDEILCSETDKSLDEKDKNLKNEFSCMLCQHELKTVYFLSCCWCQSVICLLCFVAYKKKTTVPEICRCNYKGFSNIQINFSMNTIQGRYISSHQNSEQTKNDKLFFVKYEKLGKVLLLYSGLLYYIHSYSLHLSRTYFLKGMKESNFPSMFTITRTENKFELSFMVSESISFFIFSLKFCDKTEFRNIILSELVEFDETERIVDLKVLESETENWIKKMVEIVSKERMFSKHEMEQEKNILVKYFNDNIIRCYFFFYLKISLLLHILQHIHQCSLRFQIKPFDTCRCH